ncbi:MAG: DUF177 domain-containing protein [Thermoflexales bacterium]|nr:DUF177 domain-containing protein [Thermoflexales bacterium]MDW8350964.1 DUF177 domain-containing protein [Anaerolineae bacterium]
MRYRLHKLLYGPVGSTQVERLERGPTKFDDDLQVPYLRGAFEFVRLSHVVLLRGSVETEVPVRCVRSLEDFNLCLKVPLEDILFGLPQYPHSDADPDRQIGDDGWVDLTETLREEIIMAIPINPVHPKYVTASPADLLSALDEDDRDWLTVHLNNSQDSSGES